MAIFIVVVVIVMVVDRASHRIYHVHLTLEEVDE